MILIGDKIAAIVDIFQEVLDLVDTKGNELSPNEKSYLEAETYFSLIPLRLVEAYMNCKI